MDKKMLSQYIDIKAEIKDTRRRIRDIETELSRIDTVGDVVKGGGGGNRRYKIEGRPNVKNRKTDLLARRLRLNILEERLEGIKNDIEIYIHSIEDSHMRRIMTYRYIDGMTWDAVAYNMGYNYTGDSLRIEHQRFLKKEGAI